MKTIHITSQDELPQVAGAIIGSLAAARWSPSAARWARAKPRSSVKSPQNSGRRHRDQPHVRHRQPIQGREHRRIHHFDFYRINDLREAFDFGYEEYFYSGDLCLVEWPEKIEQLLPDNTMTVRITVDSDTARTFEID